MVVVFISTQSRDELISDFKLALKHISSTVYFLSFIIIPSRRHSYYIRVSVNNWTRMQVVGPFLLVRSQSLRSTANCGHVPLVVLS
jgi:hypothetical protein